MYYDNPYIWVSVLPKGFLNIFHTNRLDSQVGNVLKCDIIWSVFNNKPWVITLDVHQTVSAAKEPDKRLLLTDLFCIHLFCGMMVAEDENSCHLSDGKYYLQA